MTNPLAAFRKRLAGGRLRRFRDHRGRAPEPTREIHMGEGSVERPNIMPLELMESSEREKAVRAAAAMSRRWSKVGEAFTQSRRR